MSLSKVRRGGLLALLCIGLWSVACEGCEGLPYCYVDADCADGQQCVQGACHKHTEPSPTDTPDERPGEVVEPPFERPSREPDGREHSPEPSDDASEPGREARGDASDSTQDIAGPERPTEPQPEPSSDADVPLCQQVPNPTYSAHKGWVRLLDGSNRISSAGFEIIRDLVVDGCGFAVFGGLLLPEGRLPDGTRNNKARGHAYIVRMDRSGQQAWGWLASTDPQNTQGRTDFGALLLQGETLWVGLHFTYHAFIPAPQGGRHRLPPTGDASGYDPIVTSLKLHDLRGKTTAPFATPSWYPATNRDEIRQLLVDSQGRLHALLYFESPKASLPGKGQTLSFLRPAGASAFYVYGVGTPSQFTHARSLGELSVTRLHLDDNDDAYIAGQFAKDTTIDGCQLTRGRAGSNESFVAQFGLDPTSSKIPCQALILGKNSSDDRSYIRVLQRLGPRQALIAGEYSGQLKIGGITATPVPNGPLHASLVGAYDLQQRKLLWHVKLYGPHEYIRIESAAVDPQGNIYVAGGFQKEWRLYANDVLQATRTSQGRYALFVASWDRQGSFRWCVTADLVDIPNQPNAPEADGLIVALAWSPGEHLYASGWFRGRVVLPLAWQGATPLYQQGAEKGQHDAWDRSAGFLWKVPIPPTPSP